MHKPAASDAAAIHGAIAPAVVTATASAPLADAGCPTFQRPHLGPLAVEQAWDVGLVVPQGHLQSTALTHV